MQRPNRLWRDIPITAQQLREMEGDSLKQYLSQLSPKQIEELKYTAEFWARPEQLEPEGKHWNTWFFLAGRGAGKTYAGSQWIRHRVKCGDKRLAAITSTNGDIEKVVIKGESGLLNICWKEDRTYRGAKMGAPVWSPTKRTLSWENGAELTCFSAEEPERLRGPQFQAIWADELAAWNKDMETWDMAQFGLRLGSHPRAFVTTTPKPTKLVRKLLADPTTHITRGTTFDNSANLAGTFLKKIKEDYEGTRLGKQELYAEVLEEAEGALWTTDMLDNCQVSREDVPDLQRIVVAIDPAITSNAESDMTGIVVAGVDINGIVYVLGDYTEKLSPQGWASKAISLYHKWEADRIVAEKNQGGDMVRRTLEVEDETVPIKLVHASRGKMARAEPVSALYERGLVKHVRNPVDGANLEELETQMRTWEPLGSIGSPDRLDALVWACTELALGSYQRPTMQLAYESAKGLR